MPLKSVESWEKGAIGATTNAHRTTSNAETPLVPYAGPLAGNSEIVRAVMSKGIGGVDSRGDC
jgi:hypothetical protein